MSDRYFTAFQSIDYAEHFLAEAQKLVGLSGLVDVTQLRLQVTASKERIETELSRAGITRSSSRTHRVDLKEATTTGRRMVKKFFNHLGTVDGPLDLAAFFPGRRLGPLAALKPADVKIKLDEVLDGFDAPIHANLADRDKWKQRLVGAREELAEALEDQQGVRGDSIRHTATLVTTREDFLTVYNGVAKPLVRGLLTSLGRKDEMPLFFKDLQVIDGPREEDGEKTPPDKVPPKPAPTTDAPKAAGNAVSAAPPTADKSNAVSAASPVADKKAPPRRRKNAKGPAVESTPPVASTSGAKSKTA